MIALIKMDTISTKEMRILDKNAQWFGVPASELMENAGRAVAEEANKLGDSFLVICGRGNNGGDGFATSRYLKSKPAIFYTGDPKSTEAYENFIKARNYKPIKITRKTLPALAEALKKYDVVIDALFGTGISGHIREPIRSVIKMINDSSCRVLSIDVPSGVDPDTGEAHDIAVKPHLTVSLHMAKRGVLRAKGRVVVRDIGIPKEASTHVGWGDFFYLCPKRPRDAHKGSAGRVLVVGGSRNYTGAPLFSALASLRAGCDLSYVAAPQVPAGRISTIAPDLIVYPLSSSEFLGEKREDLKIIRSIRADVLCIGNGLGDRKETLQTVAGIITSFSGPIVVDGDALKAAKGVLTELGPNVVLTPHATEFRRLFKLKAGEKNLKKIASTYKFTVLLKGEVDMIAQRGRIKYNTSGTPYMSKGGTGDILAGITAGLMAQGLEPFTASSLAAFLNGVAGELAYEGNSISMTASDLLSHLGLAESLLLSPFLG